MLPILVLILSGCDGEPIEQEEAAPLDPAVIEKVERDYCPQGHRLTEDAEILNRNFRLLGSDRRIFTFLKGEEECALRTGISQDWDESGVPRWFHVTLAGNCLPNQSFWKVAQAYGSGSGYYYRLQRMDAHESRLMDMNGNHDLSGLHVADSTGLRVFKCERR